MGFRSNFVTEDMPIPVSAWFIEKYPTLSYSKIDDKAALPIAQLWESKFYRQFNEDERLLDIQKLLVEYGEINDIVLILLHECGGITRVKITKDSITAREPIEWKEVESVEHDYCYGCSDKKENV